MDIIEDCKDMQEIKFDSELGRGESFREIVLQRNSEKSRNREKGIGMEVSYHLNDKENDNGLACVYDMAGITCKNQNT